MTLYAIKKTDGSVSIMKTDHNPIVEIEKFSQEDQDDVVYVRVVEPSDIPTDRTFRDAWTDDNPSDTIDVDMVKARNIHMVEIRKARDEKLLKLDVDYIRADELKDDEEKAIISENKKSLRDLPDTYQKELDKAENVDELKALWPKEVV